MDDLANRATALSIACIFLVSASFYLGLMPLVFVDAPVALRMIMNAPGRHAGSANTRPAACRGFFTTLDTCLLIRPAAACYFFVSSAFRSASDLFRLGPDGLAWSAGSGLGVRHEIFFSAVSDRAIWPAHGSAALLFPDYFLAGGVYLLLPVAANQRSNQDCRRLC